jgi:polysaccharide pyruvyl transferase WcaK-like protein
MNLGDRVLEGSMASLIEIAATRYAVDPGARWQPGEPFKLLLAGYSGTRNTGADVRVEEMIRQFRHLWGDEHLELSILTIDPDQSRGYFRTAKQLHLPQIFPAWLAKTVRAHHGVVACEGSMFKSKFANALATMMTGALGLAAAENKVAVGYGGEAGKMDDHLRDLVGRYCRDTLQICRNDNSARILGDLGIPCRIGTDTAWTYQPPPIGERVLRDLGWDGRKPVLAISPINAFWWPVKADVGKAFVRALTGAHRQSHYASVYFHADGPEVERKQATYLDALAQAALRFRDEHDAFLFLYGSEALDRRACEALADRIDPRPPLLVSDEHDYSEMVAALWHTDVLVASRFHAIVCSMAGKAVSVGVTMDERIRNLMADRGTPALSLEVDQPDLAEALSARMEHAWAHREEMRDGIERTVVRNLRRMGHMGAMLVDHVRARHPEMPFADGLGEHGDPWDHLPPLSARLAELRDRFAPDLPAELDRSRL